METIRIAIDGPSGAGKSTLAKRLARELGFLYIDTGAIYRAIGLYARRAGVDPTDAAAVTALLPQIAVTLSHGEDGQHVFLNGEDVSSAIREHEISRYASAVSAIGAVRDFLLELQRRFGREQNVVMDGRDIGTVVLPDAQLKIFLTASAEERARRRYVELQEKGQTVDYDTVLRDVIQRDHNDSTRAIAPLRQAEDAVLLDTTENTLEEAAQRMIDLAKEKLHHVL